MEFGYTNPLQDKFSVTCVLRGVRRSLGDSVQRKVSITPRSLLELLSVLNVELVVDSAVWAASLVAFLPPATTVLESPPPGAGVGRGGFVSSSFSRSKGWSDQDLLHVSSRKLFLQRKTAVLTKHSSFFFSSLMRTRTHTLLICETNALPMRYFVTRYFFD